MARYKAIGRAKFAAEEEARKFKREESALQRAHQAEMARLDREHKSTEGAADRTLRKEEGAADRTLRKEEGAADRQHREDMKYIDIDAQAEEARLAREATAERDKFAATERAKAAKLKAQAESITSDSVLSALNNTSYKSSNGEQADASGGYKVFSLTAWIDGQVTAAVTAAEDAAAKEAVTSEKYNNALLEEEKQRIVADAKAAAGEKARVAAARAATEQANNALEAMTLKARQYVLSGKKPEDALKLVKEEFGSQSNSLFAKHFRPRQNPTTVKAEQKTQTEKTTETQQQGWFKSKGGSKRKTN